MASQPGLFEDQVTEPASDSDNTPVTSFAQVAVNQPVFHPYTYGVPASLVLLRTGSIVEVPFGRQTTRGCVVALLPTLPPDLNGQRVRKILRLVTPEYCLNDELIYLARWIAEYYIEPVGATCGCVSFIGFNDIGAKTVRRFELSSEGRAVADGTAPGVRLGPKQRAVLEFLRQEVDACTIEEMHEGAGANLSTIQTLAGRGLVLESRERESRADDYEQNEMADTELLFSDQQQSAFDSVEAALEEGRAETFLLHGATGSGKTEIYLQGIAWVLARGGEAVVLVPEISLTPQTVSRFRRRFGGVVGVYHSRLTLGQKYDLWQSIETGKVKILIGARSAVFAPFKNLRLIVVDEEHEGSYKQDSSPRYHARDIAIVRASRSGAVVLLGSATPSIETYYKAVVEGKFTLLPMPDRIDDRPLPPVNVIDMTKEIREEHNPDPLSHALRAAMEQAMGRQEQVLLLLNRRGFFNFMICLQCHTAISCKHCDTALTFHKLGGRLICHYCSREYVPAKQCPKCESNDLNMIGWGTQRLEETLETQYPTARVLRLDLDTTRSRTAFLEAWKLIEGGAADIIVGTQMIAKGIHVENVTVVGVPLADVSLFQPDFRATERAFSLLTQVAGRAGRGQRPGRVYIQTYVPHHYAIQFAQTHDYIGFYRKEVRVREVLKFPPFYRLLSVQTSSKDEQAAADLTREFGRLLKDRAIRNKASVDVLGPSPAPITRINDVYRWRVLLRGKGQGPLKQVFLEALKKFADVPGKSRLQIVADVDPLDLL